MIRECFGLHRAREQVAFASAPSHKPAAPVGRRRGLPDTNGDEGASSCVSAAEGVQEEEVGRTGCAQQRELGQGTRRMILSSHNSNKRVMHRGWTFFYKNFPLVSKNPLFEHEINFSLDNVMFFMVVQKKKHKRVQKKVQKKRCKKKSAKKVQKRCKKKVQKQCKKKRCKKMQKKYKKKGAKKRCKKRCKKKGAKKGAKKKVQKHAKNAKIKRRNKRSKKKKGQKKVQKKSAKKVQKIKRRKKRAKKRCNKKR